MDRLPFTGGVRVWKTMEKMMSQTSIAVRGMTRAYSSFKVAMANCVPRLCRVND